jgi:membrane protein DedA with SNARE-associated domain
VVSRCGYGLVLVARLVPGTRAIVFATAGANSIPISSFLRYDILGAALWVPAMLAAGRVAGRHIGSLGNVVDGFERAGAFAFLIASVVFLVWFWLGREESKL